LYEGKKGIVGLGQIAQCFNKANNSKLVAVASTDRVKLKDFTHIYGIENKYEFKSYSEPINCDAVDIVYIALPNNLHFEYIIKYIKSQKHVLVEKPATPNTGEMLQVCDLISNKTPISFTHYRRHFTKHENARQLEELLAITTLHFQSDLFRI
jgi:predicted dehydrogenase